MPTLLLLRHAKSSWKDGGLADHDRPLNDRGRRDAPGMGQLLAQRGLAPDLVISSTARRARQTARKVMRAGKFGCAMLLEPRAYLAEPQVLVEVLRLVPSGTGRVLLVGHNPGLEQLVRGLTGAEVELPTAAVACIDLADDDWDRVSLAGLSSLSALWTPREELPGDV